MNTGLLNTENSPHAMARAAKPGTVALADGFWQDRVSQCRQVTLPHLYTRMDDIEASHCLENFRVAAGKPGVIKGSFWHDEWPYKWIEAASALYAKSKDEALLKEMDGVIALITAAQAPDGYLVTHKIADGGKRYQINREHELYVMGHLITAACVHHRATGQRNFLDIALRVADYLDETFGDMPPALCRAHNNPSQIMALAELYRTTGQEKYLRLSDTFMSMQGAHRSEDELRQVQILNGDRNQDRVPLRQERIAVGHMVLGTYLYAGAADIYLETGEAAILEALDSIWNDMTTKKMYINGGVCAQHIGMSTRKDPDGVLRGKDVVIEAVGDDYELPNHTAYNETCAQIGMVMFSWRMFLITAQAKYLDVMERCLYNSILSGIGLEGDSWFYSNLLLFHGKDHPLHTQDAPQRFQPGFKHTCCPSNLLRTVAEIDEYLYARKGCDLYITHYAAGSYDDGELRLVQGGNYPWEGKLSFRVEAAPEGLALKLRIPAWAEDFSLTLNGEAVSAPRMADGFVHVPCRAGDVLLLDLPMEVRLYAGNHRIEHTRNHAAVMRGPILFCAEGVDLPEGIELPQVYLGRKVGFTESWSKELNCPVLETTGHIFSADSFGGALYAPFVNQEARGSFSLRLIPYFAWANRGLSSMAVWLPLA